MANAMALAIPVVNPIQCVSGLQSGKGEGKEKGREGKGRDGT